MSELPGSSNIQSDLISRSGLPNQGYSRVLCIALRVLCIPRARVPLCPVLSAGVGGLARGVLGASRPGEVGALVKGTLVSFQIWGSVSLRRKIGISAPRRPRRDEGYTLRCPLSVAAPPVNQRRVHSRSPPRRRVLLCLVLAQPCKFIPRRVRAEVVGRAKGTLPSCALASLRRVPGICNGSFPAESCGRSRWPGAGNVGIVGMFARSWEADGRADFSSVDNTELPTSARARARGEF